MKPICHQHRGRQCVTYRLGVGGGQVDGHVGDPGPPGLWLGVQPLDGGGTGTTFDLGEETAGAGGVDEPGVPPVAGQDPPSRLRVLGPDGFPAAGLIDPQDAHWWQWRRERGPDVCCERGVDAVSYTHLRAHETDSYL